MLHRLLLRISDRLPAREIRGPNGEPYLERYYIGRLFGWTFYLHRFLDSDPDRGLHDHPWDVSVSLVLSGGYEEIRLRHVDCTGVHTRSRFLRGGSLNIIRADTFHRVIFHRGKHLQAWTLFATHRRLERKRWGFMRWDYICAVQEMPAGVKVKYTQYVGTVDTEWHLDAPNGRELRERQAADRHREFNTEIDKQQHLNERATERALEHYQRVLDDADEYRLGR